MLFTEFNGKGMGELMNLDLDYQQMNGFGRLSPLTVDLSAGTCPEITPKTEEELTLLNISGNKPVMTTVNSPLNPNNEFAANALQLNPQNIDNLLQVIENQEKQNERMLIQFRLKQVLLDYLKTKQCPKPFQGAVPTSGASITATGSPSLCQQQNHCVHTIEAEDQRLGAVMNEAENICCYPIDGQSPPLLLTPPISPDISQQFFLTNRTTNGEQQKSSQSLSFIGLNGSQELIESQELSDSIERFYSSESEGQTNNELTFNDEELEDDFDDNNQNLFDETFDYPTAQPSAYSNSMTSSPTNSITNTSFNVSPIHVSPVQQTKAPTVKSDNNSRNNSRNRKQSSMSAPGESSAQMQKRSAHLSAEFRYRTKLNDKITKLRNIVGPKSQLSKSGVLSRSIDLITKLQKSNNRLKDENKKIRMLLIQAYNQLPGNVGQANLIAK